MNAPVDNTIYLSSYQSSPWLVEDIHLCFELGELHTLVTTTTRFYRHRKVSEGLVLQGEQLDLQSVTLDGNLLEKGSYQYSDTQLILSDLPEKFTLEVQVKINPQENTSLEGLYQSSGNFCTQCEAEGFRKISYHLDRPDVMTCFTTKIIAEKAKYPVLLSNGNLIEQGDLDNGLHYAKWHDPHKKPAYLFALVAGDLDYIEDAFTTASGREVSLKIYTETHNIPYCDYAMQSLKRAMAWDEQRFGLEYDLDIYMIVAVDDFNMGAMENKGLNIFNSSLVFASPETATDDKYLSIEAVIGHEYFHNWTGNRVTCRDWFQLSLKEGLTVFRDQEFTADLHARAVKRIDDVALLRAYQFAEDASPMSHPIRPASYMEINNFYTVTVYEKGAEVVRLYQTLLGKDGFRKGLDLYFQRHDGQAVTTEDFLAAMADANSIDLSQMQRWYDQAGTPIVDVTMDYNKTNKSCELTFVQSCPVTPESETKQPFLIPIDLALLDSEGNEIPLQLESEKQASGGSRVVRLSDDSLTVRFINIAEQPLPSLLRDFSAPVILKYDYQEADYIFLMANDTDSFNRWQAGQGLLQSLLLNMLDARANDQPYGVSPAVIDAYQSILNNDSVDPALRALSLSLPAYTTVAEWLGQEIDPAAIVAVVDHFADIIAKGLRLDLERHYAELNVVEEYQPEHHSMGRRALKNICLLYLARIDDQSTIDLCYQQFNTANNMTDEHAAFIELCSLEAPESEKAVEEFARRWADHTQVMNSWFSLQASAKKPEVLATVMQLFEHPQFSMNNPNKVRALLGGFMANYRYFHAEDGSGYRLVANKVIELDAINPQVAARMVRVLIKWRQYEPMRGKLMKDELKKIAVVESLSGDVAEIVSKALR
ncbi:MAG: aminopeptidase N [Thiotrichaceae bacterium]|nr:aminopeptidase N [Thiotrichaceae bacterium]